MRRVVVLVTVVCLGVLLWVPVYAESVKVGYVDLQKIVAGSKRGAAQKQLLERKEADLRGVIQKKQSEVQELKETLEKQAVMLSEEARREKEKEYQKELKELERLVKDSRQEMQQLEMELTTKVLKDIEKIVVELGKKGGYTLILERNERIPFILYATKEIDLTEQVIKVFDASEE